MPDVYLGAGHGVKPNGTFDPDAQAPGRNEYKLNWQVVTALAAALKRSVIVRRVPAAFVQRTLPCVRPGPIRPTLRAGSH
jgi:hypothetical protein